MDGRLRVVPPSAGSAGRTLSPESFGSRTTATTAASIRAPGVRVVP